jgi:hypothetical protein
LAVVRSLIIREGDVIVAESPMPADNVAADMRAARFVEG